MGVSSTFDDLKKYVDIKAAELGWRKKDEAFAFWFCQAALTDADETDKIKNSITNGRFEKECDIVLLNDQNKTINICQAKYRTKLGAGTEKEKDVTALIDTVKALIGDEDNWTEFIAGASRKIKDILPLARDRFLSNQYDIILYFLTPHRISKATKDEADRRVLKTIEDGSLERDRIRYIYLDSTTITDIFEDFQLQSPYIPQIILEVVGDVCHPQRTDPPECLVFSTSARSINRLYKGYQDKLFAKNIRLGVPRKKLIPNAIRETLLYEPENFFYMNNGITFLADSLQQKGNSIYIGNPQIINGQQTTRNIGEIKGENKIKQEAIVLIKAISTKQGKPRTKDQANHLVNGIIKASNSQNPVKITQLVSNNKEQIMLEKDLAQQNWLYERKLGQFDKPPKKHAELSGKKTGSFNITKITDAVLSNIIDPQIVPSNGAPRIFDSSYKDFEGYYEKIFKASRSTHEFIFHFLVSEAAKPSKNFKRNKIDAVLHRRGRWYISFSIHKIMNGAFKRNSKYILQKLGHSLSGPVTKDPNIKKLSSIFHEIWSEFFRLKGQVKYKQNPAAFIQSDLARADSWSKFSKSHLLYREAKKVQSEISKIRSTP